MCLRHHGLVEIIADVFYLCEPKYGLWSFQNERFFLLGERENSGVNAGLILIKHQYLFTSSINFGLNFMSINLDLGQKFYLSATHRAMHLLNFIF